MLGRSYEYVGSRIYCRKYFYLFEHTIKPRDPAPFLPRLDNYEMRVVASNPEADRLAAEMGFDFREHILNARRRLERGVVAFPLFAGGEFAYVGWTALDAGAKAALDAHPYTVDFAGGQACTGGTFTMPAFRGRGLMTYGYYRAFEFLAQRGFVSTRNVVEVGNVASQKAHARFVPRVCARARYTRLLWWVWWREFPVDAAHLPVWLKASVPQETRP